MRIYFPENYANDLRIQSILKSSKSEIIRKFKILSLSYSFSLKSDSMIFTNINNSDHIVSYVNSLIS